MYRPPSGSGPYSGVSWRVQLRPSPHQHTIGYEWGGWVVYFQDYPLYKGLTRAGAQTLQKRLEGLCQGNGIG
jgi:hypothetical protein